MSKSGLSLVVLLCLVFYDAVETAMHFCFKKTALTQASFHIQTPADIPAFIGHVLLVPYLWAGLAGIVVVVSTWTFILSKVDLSLAIPFAGLTYIFVALVSQVFFHEHISLLRWAGIFLILAGVITLSASAGPKEEGSP